MKKKIRDCEICGKNAVIVIRDNIEKITLGFCKDHYGCYWEVYDHLPSVVGNRWLGLKKERKCRKS